MLIHHINKHIVHSRILRVVFLLVAAGLFFMGMRVVSFAQTEPQAAPQENSIPAVNQSAVAVGFEVEGQILTQIMEISSIKMDTSFFQSPVFKSLTDFSQEIPLQEVGRLDPFAPVDTGKRATSTAQGGTVAPSKMPR